MTTPDLKVAASELRLASSRCERAAVECALGHPVDREVFDVIAHHMDTASSVIAEARKAAESDTPALSLEAACRRVEVSTKNLAELAAMAARGEHVPPRVKAHQERLLSEARSVVDASRSKARRRKVA